MIVSSLFCRSGSRGNGTTLFWWTLQLTSNIHHGDLRCFFDASMYLDDLLCQCPICHSLVLGYRWQNGFRMGSKCNQPANQSQLDLTFTARRWRDGRIRFWEKQHRCWAKVESPVIFTSISISILIINKSSVIWHAESSRRARTTSNAHQQDISQNVENLLSNERCWNVSLSQWRQGNCTEFVSSLGKHVDSEFGRKIDGVLYDIHLLRPMGVLAWKKM